MVEQICKLAEEQGISMAKLEKLSDTHNIRRWDDNCPSIDKVERVAEALGVSVDYLLGRTEEKDELLEKLARNKDLKAFMMTASKCNAEELRALEGMIRTWKKS